MKFAKALVTLDVQAFKIVNILGFNSVSKFEEFFEILFVIILFF
jgi:hypothetical protein